MSMDNIGASPSSQLANTRSRYPINLPFARNQMRLDAFLNGSFVKLMIWIRRIREHPQHAAMRPTIEGARDVQDHSLGPVHSTAADNVQNLHSALSPRSSLSGSFRFKSAQSFS